jgi:hypothetical protein
VHPHFAFGFDVAAMIDPLTFAIGAVVGLAARVAGMALMERRPHPWLGATVSDEIADSTFER